LIFRIVSWAYLWVDEMAGSKAVTRARQKAAAKAAPVGCGVTRARQKAAAKAVLAAPVGLDFHVEPRTSVVFLHFGDD